MKDRITDYIKLGFFMFIFQAALYAKIDGGIFPSIIVGAITGMGYGLGRENSANKRSFIADIIFLVIIFFISNAGQSRMRLDPEEFSVLSRVYFPFAAMLLWGRFIQTRREVMEAEIAAKLGKKSDDEEDFDDTDDDDEN